MAKTVNKGSPRAKRNLPILLVDDNPRFLKDTRMALARARYTNVLTAVDVPTALKIIEAFQPVVALVDLDLGKGEEGGLELIKLLAGRPDGPLPVVLSGDRSHETFFRAARAGAVDFLVKDPKTSVPREVGRLLEGQRGAVAGRALPEVIADLGYLRTLRVREEDIQALVEFSRDLPTLAELSRRLECSSEKTRKQFSRLYKRLKVKDGNQLVRLLTICELFGLEN